MQLLSGQRTGMAEGGYLVQIPPVALTFRLSSNGLKLPTCRPDAFPTFDYNLGEVVHQDWLGTSRSGTAPRGTGRGAAYIKLASEREDIEIEKARRGGKEDTKIEKGT